MSEVPILSDGPLNGDSQPKPKVLFVDDEAGILSALQRLLRKESYDIRTTTSPEEALKLVAGEKFAAVISDHRMPEMEGTALLERVKKISPETVRVILTGYADLNATLDAINKGFVYRFLSKPWNDQELIMTVRQAVAQFDLLQENRRLHELTLAQNHELRDLNGNLEKKVEERTAETVRLHKDLEKSFLASVRALAGFTEMNSPHIGSHSRRVAARSKAMARLLGLPSKDAMQLEVAALLHDIGEIALPPEILRKPANLLKPNELQIWQKHVLQGDGVLRMVPHFEKASKMVRHHHENYNGSGFPDRLKGENIPLGARIIAVADAYDGILNNKADYQMATPEKALAWLLNRSAMEFDPAVLEALVASLKEESNGPESNEVEVSLSDLREGMVLSRDVRGSQGVLLLARGTALSAEHLARITIFLNTEQIEAGDVFIRRIPAEAAAESPSKSPVPSPGN